MQLKVVELLNLNWSHLMSIYYCSFKALSKWKKMHLIYIRYNFFFSSASFIRFRRAHWDANNSREPLCCILTFVALVAMCVCVCGRGICKVKKKPEEARKYSLMHLILILARIESGRDDTLAHQRETLLLHTRICSWG